MITTLGNWAKSGVSKTVQAFWLRLSQLAVTTLVAISLVVPPLATPAYAAGDERSLYLYYTHTKETARIVYKRNGRWDQDGLNKLNHFLRDWRRNEPAKMDPALFDLIWAVYNEVRATQPIHIVSAYRSPATNAMLRKSSSGVAENSQHTKGHAMDFFIPGVPLDTLRAVAMKHQVGGVGYYPTSGSPFVHLDTGTVRAWPRMTRTQLAKVFPDGKTLHLPTDGKPLSSAGRQYAQAEWEKCRQVPCGAIPAGGGGGNNLLDMIFGGDKGQPVQVASAPPAAIQQQPAQRSVQAVAVSAPVPLMRPEDLPSADVPATIPFQVASIAAEAPIPLARPERAPATPEAAPQTAMMALAALDAPIPAARVQISPSQAEQEPPQVLSAYVSPADRNGTINAPRVLMSPPTTAAIPPAAPQQPLRPQAGGQVQMASLGGEVKFDTLRGLMENTWNAFANRGGSADSAVRALPGPSIVQFRAGELVAPDVDHVTEVFMQPETLASDRFAVFYEHDTADFDPTTEMGIYGATDTFRTGLYVGLSADEFAVGGVAHMAESTIL